MKVKKINAVLGLLAIGLLFTRVIYEIYSYFTFYYNPKVTVIIAYGFVTCMMLHAVISMTMLGVIHDGNTIEKYPKENIRTILQRASVGGLLLLLPFHIKTGDWIAKKFGGFSFLVVLIILGVLFWAFTFIHVGASFTRALITLGIIKTSKTQKILDWIIWVICGILFLLSVFIIIKTQIALFYM